MDDNKYPKDERIIGVQIGLQLDCIFFTPEPIDNEEDEFRLQKSIQNFAQGVCDYVNATYNRTEGDDTVYKIAFTEHITPANKDNYIIVEEIPIE